ncbi:hypothetical protein ACWJJH_21535 [Endozoicomonadaceae bacterium StTr2]
MTAVTFIYGPMKSGKTARLIGDYYALSDNHTVAVVRPALDTRSPDGRVKSRNGSELNCYVFRNNAELMAHIDKSQCDVLLIDEAQFLASQTVLDLVRLSLDTGCQIRFYGLMTDYKGNTFSAAETITRFAQKLEPLFADCECGEPAQFTKFTGDTQGRTIIVGHDQSYFPVCTRCFLEPA